MDCEREIASIKEEGISRANFSDIFMAPFLLCFRLILRRDYLNMMRGGWKIKVIALQTIMKMLLLGLLYMNSIPSADKLNSATYPIKEFIFAQTTSFSNIAGNLMPALLSVALSCILYIIQCLHRGSFIIRKLIRRSIPHCLTSLPKLYSNIYWYS
jgi:hypothetical protein